MWTWLLPILSIVGKWLWHAVSRFWSVFLIGAIIAVIALQFFNFKNTLYNTGYKKGYSQALTDHPTQSGTIYNNNIKTTGIEIDGFGFGFWHRK